MTYNEVVLNAEVNASKKAAQEGYRMACIVEAMACIVEAIAAFRNAEVEHYFADERAKRENRAASDIYEDAKKVTAAYKAAYTAYGNILSTWALEDQQND